MIRVEYLRLLGFAIAARAWILSAVFFAIQALKAQFAILGMSVTDQMVTATMRAIESLGKHKSFLPNQTKLGHYPEKMVYILNLKIRRIGRQRR